MYFPLKRAYYHGSPILVFNNSTFNDIQGDYYSVCLFATIQEIVLIHLGSLAILMSLGWFGGKSTCALYL